MANNICLLASAIALCAVPLAAKAQAPAPHVAITATTLASRSPAVSHVPPRSGRVITAASSPRMSRNAPASAVKPLTPGQAVRVSVRPAPVSPRQ